MLCDFAPLPPDQIRCRRCQRTLRGPLTLRARCRAPDAPTGPRPPRPPFAGPGRELTRFIHQARLREPSQCQCEQRARQMNEWGPAGCRERVETIAAWLRESFAKLDWRTKLTAAIALKGKLDWRRPIESLIDLAITSAEAKTLSVLVLAHEPEALEQLTPARHLRPINLTDIEADNRLAESRIFIDSRFTILDSSATYLGLATANWNRKYGPRELWHGRKWPHCLPLERLDELDLGEPHVVHCAAITDETWAAELDDLFPGCAMIVDELVGHFHLDHKLRPGPLANNFVAARDVALDHASFMRATIHYLDGRYGRDWPVSGERLPCFASRLPAFACECASILYFANRPDLELRQIPPP